MGQPTWRQLVVVQVPERPANLWTPALDYVTPARLYQIVVRPQPPAAPAVGPPTDQLWTPEAASPCTADGDPAMNRNGSLLIDGCAAGALIGKIGGSTADSKPDKDKVVLFSVGRHCVFSIADATKTGSLYLGINDVPQTVARVQGRLEVTILEAL